ncbi:MAG: hypothetical protein WAU75_21610 [Solirubrobacteraceae bacterium]
MGAAELTPRRTVASAAPLPTAAGPARVIALAYAGMWALTAAGVLLGALLPALAPGGRPRPTLHGTLAELSSIAAGNARVLSAPFLLALFRFPAGDRSRRIGDLLVGGLLAGNALRVGLALGRWHQQLLPYLPQLPLEWLAAGLAGGAWLTLRVGGRTQTAVVYLAAVLALVLAAATFETLGTPHAHHSPTGRVGAAPRSRRCVDSRPHAVRDPGVDCLHPDRAPAPARAARSLRSLPLAVARFRPAAWPARPGFRQPPRIPQRRDQE